MRIEIAGTVIAGTDYRESVRGFTLQGGPQVQKIMPLRASEPTWIDRGNNSAQASFEVCRLHATLADATVFILDHLTSLTYVGKITIEEDYEGAKAVRQGNGCIRQIGQPRQVGLTTFTRYELEIGNMTKPK